ncbi:MAG: single-stranded DNA-binding protein [Actinomycetota bacterium]|nr:single-stranded DNA-binding protein [Actinomycetota bacterium]
MADNSVTIVGNVTDDPELRFTPSGQAVANFTVAVNKRFKNNAGDWEDRLDGFFRCSCWRDMAENVSETLKKGTRVVVTGRLQQRSWDDAEGNKRSAFEIQVDEVGPSLRWATATITKSQRTGGASAPAGAPAAASAPTGGAPAPATDWGTPSPVGGAEEGSF